MGDKALGTQRVQRIEQCFDLAVVGVSTYLECPCGRGLSRGGRTSGWWRKRRAERAILLSAFDLVAVSSSQKRAMACVAAGCAEAGCVVGEPCRLQREAFDTVGVDVDDDLVAEIEGGFAEAVDRGGGEGDNRAVIHAGENVLLADIFDSRPV